MASDPDADALHLVLGMHDHELRERVRLIDEVAPAQGDRDVIIEVFTVESPDGSSDPRPLPAPDSPGKSEASAR